MTVIGTLEEAQTTPPAISEDLVITSGSTAVGVGPSRMARVGSTQPANPVSFQAQDNDWFVHADNMFRVENIGELDDGDPHKNAQIINEFFAYCYTNRVDMAYCGFSALVDSTILVGGAGPALGKTLTLFGSPELRASQAIAGALLEVQNVSYLDWYGKPRLIGSPSASTGFSGRNAREGLRLGAAERFRWGGAYIDGFQGAGIIAAPPTKQTASDLGHVSVVNCGSGKAGSYSITSAWGTSASGGTRVDSGSPGSIAQTTTVKVDTLPPNWTYGSGNFVAGHTPGPLGVMIDGIYHHVMSVDSANSKITVYPWIDLRLTGGTTLVYVFGAGVMLAGGDASAIRIGTLDARSNGVGLWDGALYGSISDALLLQGNGIGLMMGLEPFAASLGHYPGPVYPEGNEWLDIAALAQGTTNYGTLRGEYFPNLSKIRKLCAPRQSASTAFPDGQFVPSSSGMSSFEINAWGMTRIYEKPGSNEWNNTNTQQLQIDRKNVDVMIKANSKTIALPAIDPDLNRLVGYDSAKITAYGTGTDGAPTGTWTFSAQTGSRPATVTSGSATVSGIDTKGLLAGQAVSGTGIPGSTTIASVNSATQITLTASATANGTSVTAPIGTVNGGVSAAFTGLTKATTFAMQFDLATAAWTVVKT